MKQSEKVTPVRERVTTIGDRGSRIWLYPINFKGIWLQRRRMVAYILTVIYFIIPWIHIGGQPAVLLDLRHRKMALFGLTLWPQDTLIFWFFMVGLGLSLFMVTAWWGRIWCGWACPQTVFMEHLFRPIEVWVEGNARQRKRLDAAPWNFEKIRKKLTKYILFVLVSSAVANTFLFYFAGTDRVLEMMTSSPVENKGWFFFMMFINLAFIFNFSWFREQLCLVACPYGRFQSVMLDDNSLIVGYDAKRGEPHNRKAKAEGLTPGDCIDCRQCVNVCPTGIDIRHGLQMECVNCTACIDACDEVMDKMKRPRGLIRYSSINELSGKESRFWRPRPIVYAVLILILWTTGGVIYTQKDPLRIQFLRPAGDSFSVDGEVITNQFVMKAIHKGQEPVILDLEAQEGVELITPFNPWTIEEQSTAKAPILIRINRADMPDSGRQQVTIRFKQEGREDRVKRVELIGSRQ